MCHYIYLCKYKWLHAVYSLRISLKVDGYAVKGGWLCRERWVAMPFMFFCAYS